MLMATPQEKSSVLFMCRNAEKQGNYIYKMMNAVSEGSIAIRIIIEILKISPSYKRANEDPVGARTFPSNFGSIQCNTSN